MGSFRAVAIFPYIDPSNFDQFCALASQMMQVIRQQESIISYDMFFSDNNTRCTVLEQFSSADGVIEHVQANAQLLEQMSKLGGKIEGSIFPIDQHGAAIDDIAANWDSKFHTHFLGKN